MTKIFTDAENQAWAKKLPGKMCSACLILRADNKVLMVKAGYKDHWTFPSGIVDEQEAPKAAALRETNEEVGLQFKNADCALFAIIYSSSKNGSRDRFNFAFITDVQGTTMALSVPNDEIEAAKWVDCNQVARLSGNKGSYVVFQRFLTGSQPVIPYVEI